jgi:hypothetical protein
MKTLSEWLHGTLDKKLLEKCRDIVAGIEPEAEVFLYGSRRFPVWVLAAEYRDDRRGLEEN